jgi:hypothetical protein
MANHFKEVFGVVQHRGTIPRYWQIDTYRSEINAFVDEQQRIFSRNGTPTMIWDRAGGISFVNEPYKKLTQWKLPLPTREGFHFHTVRSFLMVIL